MRCQTIKALKLHTIFALIASIFIRDIIQIRLNLFYFMRKIQRNKHSNMVYTKQWCAECEKKESARKRPDVVIALKLICFSRQSHTRASTDQTRRGREAKIVNKSLWLLPTNSFSIFNFFFYIKIINQTQRNLNQIIGFYFIWFDFIWILFLFSFRDPIYLMKPQQYWHWDTHYQHHSTFND